MGTEEVSFCQENQSALRNNSTNFWGIILVIAPPMQYLIHYTFLQSPAPSVLGD